MDTKNPIPYYTLKQAAKILNHRLGTKIYNPTLILRMATTYDIDLYAFFHGNWSINCDCNIPINRLESEEAKKAHKRILIDIENIIECSLSDGALLRLDKQVIEEIHSFKNYKVNPDCDYRGITGFVPIGHFFDTNTHKIINKILFESRFESILYLKPEQFREIEIYAIYPRCPDYSEGDRILPQVESYKYDEEEEDIYSYATITRKDIAITHIQLEKIINDEIKIHGKSQDDLEKTHTDHLPKKNNIYKKRGVSQAKLDAKLAAQTLADYLWRNDKERRVRIKEMAINIHAELYQTEHADQLPDKSESLEKWIEIIANKYPHSQQGGRPKNG